MIAESSTQAHAGEDGSRWVALVVLCVGMLMIVLDVTVVNVALPSIQNDLGFSQSSLAGRTLTFAAASLALIAAFLVREATASQPLIPLRVFRSRNVSGANLIQALTVAGMFGMFFLGSLYLQRVLGYDALQIGLAFLPTTLVMGTLSLRYSEKLIMRFGARLILPIGLVLVAAGLALFARVPVHAVYIRDVLPTLLLLGVGVGVSFPALMTLAMSGATPSDAGLASGLVNTTAQVGGALGLAVLATLAATRTRGLIAHGHSAAVALTDGYRLGFLIAALLIAAAIAVALLVLQSERGQQAASAQAARQDRGVGDVACAEAA